VRTGSRGSVGRLGWRRLGRQPERAEQAPHGVGLGHRAHDPAQAAHRARWAGSRTSHFIVVLDLPEVGPDLRSA
jgi:hypothetical protein